VPRQSRWSERDRDSADRDGWPSGASQGAAGRAGLRDRRRADGGAAPRRGTAPARRRDACGRTRRRTGPHRTAWGAVTADRHVRGCSVRPRTRNSAAMRCLRRSSFTLLLALLLVPATGRAWQALLPGTPDNGRPFSVVADSAGDVLVAGRVLAET